MVTASVAGVWAAAGGTLRGILAVGGLDARADGAHESGRSASEDAEQESRSYLVLDRAAYVADTREWKSSFATMEIDTTGLGVLDLASNDLALGLSALGRGERARADTLLARISARNARARAGDGRCARASAMRR